MFRKKISLVYSKKFISIDKHLYATRTFFDPILCRKECEHLLSEGNKL